MRVSAFVCSFQFKLKIDNKHINIDIYPSKINIKSFLDNNPIVNDMSQQTKIFDFIDYNNFQDIMTKFILQYNK